MFFQLTAAIFYPLALALGAEALVSITRVEDLLLKEERDNVPTGFGLKFNTNTMEYEKTEESKGLLVASENLKQKEEVKDKGILNRDTCFCLIPLNYFLNS